jgi:hypothetical protein
VPAEGANTLPGEAALPDRSSSWEIATATVAAVVIGILLSWGAVYGLNRYLGPAGDPQETTATIRTPHLSD